MKTHFKMTPEDIKGSTPRASQLCPVARTIRRELGDKYEIFVGGDYLGILCYENPFVLTANADIPLAVSDFIFSFDAGANPEPIEFDLKWREVAQ